jgi:hypothetical protein
MAFELIKKAEIIVIMEAYLSQVRPPEKIRPKLDIGYRIDNQSVFIFEIRPRWDKPSEIRTYDYAKATYINKHDFWKIYWLRSTLKWYLYEPFPIAQNLEEFLEIVEVDAYHCFKG